ncbi:hypothetical protein PGT21_035761 [Puccinia graminis f. sp. tritici]|uniref:Uncharacterized protein n=1 Tax=Puccinia graminis f. sp. tritici TaxID=56615 RepID=A0A5B0R2S0_PUCGR|nr:hypothetical protein PGT21_035761 [Puccinia graminis f. sp. tritici]
MQIIRNSMCNLPLTRAIINMFVCASFQRHSSALQLIYCLLATVSPTNSGYLKKFSEQGKTSIHENGSFREELHAALLTWPTPSVSAINLGNSWNESVQDHFNRFLGRPAWPGFAVNDPAPAPGLQRMLLGSENNTSQDVEEPISSSSNPHDTWVQDRNPSIANNESHKQQSDSDQTPKVYGNLNTRVARTIHQTSAINQVDQPCGSQVPLSHPGDDKTATRLSLNSKKRPATEFLSQQESQADVELPDQSFVDGYRMIQLLKNRYHRFREKISSEFSIRRQSATKKWIAHPALKIALYSGRRFPVVVRVLNAANNRAHTGHTLGPKYYDLIRWMYALHEEWLKSWNMPTYLYRLWQERLLDWLDFQISGSDDQNCPIIGIRSSSLLQWTEEDKFRNTQALLIDYFHQLEQKNAGITAAYLLENFKANNPISHFGANSPIFAKTHPKINAPTINDQPQELNGIPLCPNFQQYMDILLSLAARNNMFNNLVCCHNYPIEGKEFVSSFITDFSQEFQSSKVSLSNRYRTINPRFPIAMYYEQKDSENKIFYVLDQEYQKSPLSYQAILSRLRILLKAINYIHLQVYKHFHVKEEDYQQSVESIFQWIIKSILQPQGSPPLFGTWSNQGDLAPWEIENNRGFEGFQMVQLQLIKYFSEQENPKTLEKSTGLLITKWYQDHYPDELQTLCNHIKKIIHASSLNSS